MKLSEVQSSPPKILLWGLAGTGKSCFCATLGSHAELLNCDPNVRAASMFVDKFQGDRHKLEVFNALSEQPQYTFTKIKNRLYDIHDLVQKKLYTPKVVILDSLTSLGECSMKMVMANAGKLSNREKLPIPTMPEWGLGIGEVENILALLIGLPVPIIVVAHQLRVDIDESTKMIPWALGSKLPDKLPRMFTEVWYSKVSRTTSGDKYMIQPVSTSSILARSTCLKQDIDQSEGLPVILEKIGWKL